MNNCLVDAMARGVQPPAAWGLTDNPGRSEYHPSHLRPLSTSTAASTRPFPVPQIQAAQLATRTP